MKRYHYTESGLDDIWLVDGYEIDEEGNLFIYDIEALHEAIAMNIILSPEGIEPKEIRYIRHYLDWSQKALAEHLGVDAQSVARWEKGQHPIQAPAEKLLKILAMGYITDDKISGIVDHLADIDNNRVSDKVKFTHEEGRWAEAA